MSSWHYCFPNSDNLDLNINFVLGIEERRSYLLSGRTTWGTWKPSLSVAVAGVGSDGPDYDTDLLPSSLLLSYLDIQKVFVPADPS